VCEKRLEAVSCERRNKIKKLCVYGTHGGRIAKKNSNCTIVCMLLYISAFRIAFYITTGHSYIDLRLYFLLYKLFIFAQSSFSSFFLTADLDSYSHFMLFYFFNFLQKTFKFFFLSSNGAGSSGK
jgi:hypothetical protein